jgi:hypothetical protein
MVISRIQGILPERKYSSVSRLTMEILTVYTATVIARSEVCDEAICVLAAYIPRIFGNNKAVVKRKNMKALLVLYYEQGGPVMGVWERSGVIVNL